MTNYDECYKQEIYQKVKFISGTNFLTVEDTKNLSPAEITDFINYILHDPAYLQTSKLNILLNSKFPNEIEEILLSNQFQLHDEIVFFHKVLDDMNDLKSTFRFKSLDELSLHYFKDIWAATISGSLNAPSSNIDEQMNSVEFELGKNYKDSCIIAYEGTKPLGVIMPHIEPGKLKEGRLFYFGILPSERGKGKSKLLHQYALQKLQFDFNASYYVGCTSKNNIPMIKTFIKNGCKQVESNKVYRLERAQGC